MTLLVVLYTLHLREFCNQMIIANGSIVFSLGNYLVEAILAQQIIKDGHDTSHSFLGFQYFLGVGMKHAGVSAFLLCQLQERFTFLVGLYYFSQSLVHQHSVELALLTTQ